MKQIIIFFLLFSLLIALAILMDLIQGLGISETLNAFVKVGQQIKGEELVLMVIFFLPLIISKTYDYIKNTNNL
jgi:hypothetical protein